MEMWVKVNENDGHQRSQQVNEWEKKICSGVPFGGCFFVVV